MINRVRCNWSFDLAIKFIVTKTFYMRSPEPDTTSQCKVIVVTQITAMFNPTCKPSINVVGCFVLILNGNMLSFKLK